MIATIRVLLIAALTLLMTSPASADRITAGAVTYVAGAGPITVQFTSDSFTFDGRASPIGGVFMPWLQCGVPECVPGSTVDLLAFWSGTDLPGTATLEGETYSHVGSLAGTSSLLISLTGALVIPADFVSGILTAPFVFSGQFFYERLGTGSVFDLFGSGVATAAFRPMTAFPGALALDSLTYEFAADVAPTPEPASMVLLGSGLAALAAARRFRRRS